MCTCVIRHISIMKSIESPEDVRLWFLRHVSELWPLAIGSLSLRTGPCIRENCSACQRGEGHASYALYGRQKKPTLLGLRSPGNGSASSTGCRQRAEASEADRRSGTALYRSPQGTTTGGWEFREKEAREMITVRYQQRTIYEPLALNVMADYKELCWERWLLEVDGLLEDEQLV